MQKIFSKLQKYFSDEMFLINLKKENELTKFLKKELKLSTEEANIFGIVLYHYINEGCSVSIKEICENYDISNHDYLKIIDIVHSLSDKGLILTDERRKRSSKFINPDIEVDEIIFKKIVYGEDILSNCNFKDFYSIIETVESLIEYKEEDKISLQYFEETMKTIIKKIDKNISLGKLLNQYSLKENILFLYTLTKSFDSWEGENINLNEFLDLMEYSLSKKMSLLDKVVANEPPIFKDKTLEIVVDESEPLLASSIELYIRVNREIISDLLSRKIKNYKFNSKLLTHKSASDKVPKLFFDSKFSKEINKIKNFLSHKNFQKVKSELRKSGLSEGAVILFYGTPGTGKTALCYEISRATGRDILHVNFSQVQSMWVGESEKNMKKIFDEYRIALKNLDKEPILLFNEADSLISRRINVRDSVDQMSNTLQNILLEELENFKGIFIATTNLIENIDPAFDRRFIYKLKFEKPTPEIRAKIWNEKLPSLNHEELKAVSQYNLSGGQIDNVVKKYVINKILESKQLELSELISYIKEEINFRNNSKKILGFGNEKK